MVASAPPPGATRSRPGPVSEYVARQPCSVVAPTETTPGSAAGYATRSLAVLPAAARISAPFLRAYRTADAICGICEADVVDVPNSKLRLITCACCRAA